LLDYPIGLALAALAGLTAVALARRRDRDSETR
jgi:hypothetical protein